MFGSLEEATAMRGSVERFEPRMNEEHRARRLAGWREAVDAVLSNARLTRS
jgi:glycerol kinase